MDVVVTVKEAVVVSVLVVGKATEPKAAPMTSKMTATPTNDRIVELFIYPDDSLEGTL